MKLVIYIVFVLNFHEDVILTWLRYNGLQKCVIFYSSSIRKSTNLLIALNYKQYCHHWFYGSRYYWYVTIYIKLLYMCHIRSFIITIILFEFYLTRKKFLSHSRTISETLLEANAFYERWTGYHPFVLLIHEKQGQNNRPW